MMAAKKSLEDAMNTHKLIGEFKRTLKQNETPESVLLRECPKMSFYKAQMRLFFELGVWDEVVYNNVKKILKSRKK